MYVPLKLTETRKKIIKMLIKVDVTTKKDLAKLIGVPVITTYDNLKKLEEYDLVEWFTKERTIRGRSKTYWRLTENVIKKLIDIGFREGFVHNLITGIKYRM